MFGLVLAFGNQIWKSGGVRTLMYDTPKFFAGMINDIGNVLSDLHGICQNGLKELRGKYLKEHRDVGSEIDKGNNNNFGDNFGKKHNEVDGLD